MEKNIITDFVHELLLSVGISKGASPEVYTRLADVLEQRVNTRVFLEILNALSPEQAALLRAEMDVDRPDPTAFFARIGEQIPDFPVFLLDVLTGMREELLADLSVLRAEVR